ncbi:MAG: helix-turn-helix domain-containing protein [Acidimicrobiales bacterium]
MNTIGVGPLVREWRGRRRRSQLDLAHEAGVSPKHLSFIETGRSRPSPELLLTLAHHLEVPLRERNDLLLAAGYAPRFQRTGLSDPEMEQVRASLTALLERHDPYPGLVVDRYWNVVMTNRGAGALASVLPPELAGPPLNLFRASLHPDGLAGYTHNFADWAGHLLDQLRRLVQLTADPALVALEAEILAYPNIVALSDGERGRRDRSPLILTCDLELGGARLSLLTTLTAFGSPYDVTIDELLVELFYPADDATEAALRALAATR